MGGRYISKNNEAITIRIDNELKNKIMECSNELDMSLSEFIRYSIKNEITRNDISKNQSYLVDVLDTIIRNIIQENNQVINEILESIYLKQEFIIYLLGKYNSIKLEEELDNFIMSYLGDDSQRIIL